MGRRNGSFYLVLHFEHKHGQHHLLRHLGNQWSTRNPKRRSHPIPVQTHIRGQIQITAQLPLLSFYHKEKGSFKIKVKKFVYY
jgi:hypothetical protein